MTDAADTDAAKTEDGYDGPALLIAGAAVEVEVTLRGHFDPISGSYRWYGRVSASGAVAGLVADVPKRLVLRTPHGQAETALSDVDPWGRPRVEGVGQPPFDVLSDITVEES